MFRNLVYKVLILNPGNQKITFCTEKWADMTPVEQGRHCAVCDRCVVDFSEKSTLEVLHTLTFSKEKICGHFRPDHFSLPEKKPKKSRHHLTLAALFPILLGGANTLQAQQPIVTPTEQHPFGTNTPIADQREAKKAPHQAAKSQFKGLVLDETGEPMIFCSVSIEGTKTGTSTDFDGHFTLDLDWANLPDTIRVGFYYVGYEPVQIELTATSPRYQTISMHSNTMLEEIVTIGIVVELTFWHKVTMPFRRLWRRIRW
ncbi:MAG: carboxypeptidase-like regulatory domain-containing protein [Bacteroidota bacterium]